MKSYYYDDGVKHYITLRRAAPEWCNLDCPCIYQTDDMFAINNGLHIEYSATAEEVSLFVRFVKASSEAFYRKYPHLREKANSNGFVKNLIYENRDRHIEL